MSVGQIIAITLSTGLAYYLGIKFIYANINQEQGNKAVLTFLIIAGLFTTNSIPVPKHLMNLIILAIVALWIFILFHKRS